MMRAVPALICAAMAATPGTSLASATGNDVMQVTCVLGNREIAIAAFGMGGARWYEAGQILDARFGTPRDFGERTETVILQESDTTTVLTYDLHRKTENAVLAFTLVNDTSIASGHMAGTCEAVE